MTQRPTRSNVGRHCSSTVTDGSDAVGVRSSRYEGEKGGRGRAAVRSGARSPRPSGRGIGGRPVRELLSPAEVARRRAVDTLGDSVLIVAEHAGELRRHEAIAVQTARLAGSVGGRWCDTVHRYGWVVVPPVLYYLPVNGACGRLGGAQRLFSLGTNPAATARRM